MISQIAMSLSVQHYHNRIQMGYHPLSPIHYVHEFILATPSPMDIFPLLFALNSLLSTGLVQSSLESRFAI